MCTRLNLAVIAAVALCGLAGCGKPSTPPRAGTPVPPAAAKTLRVLCGSSMAGPVQEIGKTFEAERGVTPLYDFGGSETLLPRALAGAAGDVYVCHDPFEEKVRAGNRLAGSTVLGYLQPVLVLKPGNPKNIRTLEDLAGPGVSLGIGDPRYSTCGEMFVAMLEQKGLKEKIMARVTVQMRTHTELANGLIAGPLDAAVIWNFAAALYKDKLQLVDTDLDCKPVRVTVVGLTQSDAPALRDEFLKYCGTEKVQAIFREHGYTAGKK